MHSELLHSEKESDTFPYTYLLEWEWPEHIELMLRRLIWARLVELTEESSQVSAPVQSDYLAAKVCWMMVSHPDTHPAVLDVMASVDSAAFAERIAEHPRALPSTLARLAGHACPVVRTAVADNANTPAEILAILVTDEHADVRYAMAENHQLSEEVLQTLAEDENCYVASRARRTMNRIAPPSVMTMPLQRTQRAKETMRKFALG